MTAAERNLFRATLSRIIGEDPSVKKVEEGLICWHWRMIESEFCVYLHGNTAEELGLVLFNQKKLYSKKERDTTIDVIMKEARAFAVDHKIIFPPHTPRAKNDLNRFEINPDNYEHESVPVIEHITEKDLPENMPLTNQLDQMTIEQARWAIVNGTAWNSYLKAKDVDTSKPTTIPEKNQEFGPK